MPRNPGIGDNSCGSVQSSAIDAISYDRASGRMQVTFVTGRSYAYFDVSPQRYRAFCNADSKGRYFNAQIRNNYVYQKLG